MASYGRVAGLKIELEIDGSKVTKYLSTSAREVNKMQSSLKDLEKSLKLNPTNADLLKQKFELLGKAIDSTRNYLADLKNQYERLSSISDPTQKQIDQMNNLQREISDAEQQLASLSRAYESFGSVGIQQIKAVGQQMQELGGKIQSRSMELQQIAMDLERLVAPIQAAFGYSVKETMSFEQSMANVQAVTQASSDDFADMRQAAIDLSKTTVYSADETAQGLYYMGLAGWDANESIAALSGVLDLAAAGNVDLGTASSIVVDGMTAMKYSAEGYTNGIENAAHFTNVMAAAMSNSNTTVELLGESFKYAAPLAGSLGYSVDDLTLALGLMASSGIKGSQAGTGMRMALKNLAAPTEKQAELMDKYNLTMDDGYGNALELRDVINQFREDFGGLNLELVDAEGNLKTGEQLWEEYGDTLPATQLEKFGDLAQIVGVRALPGMLGMINASEEDFEQLSKAIDTADGGFVKINGEILKVEDATAKYGKTATELARKYNELGAAEAMREIQLNTTQGQLTLLKDNAAALAIEIGQDLLPYINQFIEFLQGLIEKFRNLSPETKSIILKIAGVAAAIPPVLMAISSLGRGIGGLLKFGGLLISGLATFAGFITGTVVPAISALFAFVAANPIVLLIAAIVAAIAYLATHWEQFVAAAKELWNSFVEFFTALWEGIKWMFQDVWEKIKEFASETWTAIKEKTVEIWESVKEKLSELWQAIKDAIVQWLKDAKQWCIDSWEAIKKAVTDKVTALKDKLSQLWETIKNTVTEKITALKNRITEIWEAIKTKIREVVENIKNKLVETWENIKTRISNVVEGIKERVSNIWESIKQTTKTVWETIKGLITKPIETAKNTVKNLIDTIKGFFPISLSNIFSNFKMPHLSWTWQDVGGILKIPKFSVDWYAKAMKNGMLLDGATIFGTNKYGQPMGGGEAGKEWIVGDNGLRSMIRGEVSRNQLSQEVIYNAVVAGMENANVTVIMDGQKVTNVISKRIGINQAANMRYYGV